LARAERSVPPSAGWGDGRSAGVDVAAFRAALVLDIRQHGLAWSVIVAGILGSAMLWGSILGVPLHRPAPYEMVVPSIAVDVEHPIDIGLPE
jgi:hypothetical protein